MDIVRGDIIFVENPLQEWHGHVICGNHPAVVIQNDIGNEHSDNLIVAYIANIRWLGSSVGRATD